MRAWLLPILVLSAAALAAERPAARPALASKALDREGATLGRTSVRTTELSATDPLRRAWESFADERGGTWKVWIDPRSGLPRLATGSGIPWIPGRGNDLATGTPDDRDALESLARAFFVRHGDILGRWSDRLVFDEAASVRRGAHVRQVTFRQHVGGVPVEGARYDFQLSHGNLVAFGAHDWGTVSVSPVPAVSEATARTALETWLGADVLATLTTPVDSRLLLVVEDPAASRVEAYRGARGSGYAHRLVWRFRYTDASGVELWAGEIDAHTGEVVAFYDAADHDRVKGGVNPISEDGDCAAGGCQEPDWPMPYADLSEGDGAVRYLGQHGVYACAVDGQAVTTHLDGRYFTIEDACGPIEETAACGTDLDLGASAFPNCSSVGGTSAGDTAAARTAYYALNTVARKARFWDDGSSPWLDGRVEVNTNENRSCNANWNGRINMFRAGNGCGNTAQINGILVHEWGHGYDRNDGGGGTSTSEAYADVVAILEGRESCVGRGFLNTPCGAFGDPCSTCTGVRDMDWAARASNTPATPQNFVDDECATSPGAGPGNGPCGFQVHCESFVPSEAIFDLATRDLPGSGLSQDSAWQLTERLFYQSRPGTGGAIYNCSRSEGVLVSDSCGTTGWFHELRLQDDDDGDLSNGTPHAAEIFDAFDRHGIACGDGTDPDNQSTSTCPSIGTPAPVAARLSHAVELSWVSVADADGYRVYRNELGCDRGQFPIAEVDASTTFLVDRDLANDFDVHYRVQAIGTNVACESEVSACVTTSPNGHAGWPVLELDTFGCGSSVSITVHDTNHGAGTLTVDVISDTEPTPETVTLDEVGAASGRYVGTILTTRDPAASDGLLSVTDGDVLTVTYVDADDGDGGLGVARQSVAEVACCPDLDGDGFVDCDRPGCDEVGPACGDCDDMDGAIRPDATETCNHVDDDCDGAVDEIAAKAVALRRFEDVDSDDNDEFGRTLANLGADVNGDGIDELLVGAREDSPEFTGGTGVVRLLSGATGTTLCVAFDPVLDAGDRLADSLAVIGDIDADGFPDFAAGAPISSVSAPQSGSVSLFSGRDCSHLRTLSDPAATNADNIGTSVARTDDLTGDGIPEVIAGSPSASVGGNSSRGRVLVFDPTDGTIVLELTDPLGSGGDQLGQSVAGPGDWDGDGTPDIFAGAWERDIENADPMEPDCIDGGEVVFFSGVDGAVIGRSNRGCQTDDPDVPSGAFGRYGWSMAVIGDVTGDDAPDVAVSAIDGDINNSAGPNWNNYGFVVVLSSGGTGGPVRLEDTANGSSLDDFGYSIAGVDDTDGDGWPDIVVGARNATGAGGVDAGRFYLFSGRTGAMLHRIANPDGGGIDQLGTAVVGLDDLNGDGMAEFAASTPFFDGQEARDAGKIVVASRQADCDGDGVTTWGGDCDDGDSAAAPGLTEICDGRDNDCDGIVNEDQDGDGFNVCSDCDDTDRFVFGDGPGGRPDAPERCNMIDDDCDGMIDEGDDADGDGFTTACDCRDDDALINPDAIEVCDGVDQDCNGVTDDTASTPVARRVLRDTPRGIGTNEDFGWAVAVGVDATGDGTTEIAVGSRWDDGAANRAGALFVYDGADLTPICEYREPGAQASDEFGTSVAIRRSGDAAHVAVGVPGDDDVGNGAGRAVEIRVEGNGSCTQFREFTDPSGEAGDELGTVVAWLDDLNDDGNPELAVGAPFADVSGLSNAGQVVVFDGALTTVLYRLTARYPRPSDRFGMSVTRIGDVDHDGYDDIAIGNPRDSLSGGGVQGSVEVFSGNHGGFLYKLIDPNRSTGDELGTSVAGIGDLDGDSIPDILAGVPFDDEGGSNGGAVIAFSGLTGAAIGKAFVAEPGVHENIGHAVAAAGDITGDGIPDFVAGGPHDDDVASNAGAAYVFSGADLSLVHKLTVPGSNSSANLGWSIAIADLSGDGMPEILVGSPNRDSDEAVDSGSVVIFSLEADCDDDGFSPYGGDCDDGIAQAFPGNLEVCDAIDNDCDALVDEDEDADGADACADCDNVNPRVFPGATEVCNGIDDDCNDTIDEGSDLDGDGFSGCADCDESNAAIHGSATDTCNAVDDDCDGTADEDFAVVPETLEVVESEPASQNRFGKTLARVPDVDGDGVDDLLVGLENADDSISNGGAVVLISGATMAVRCRVSDPDASSGAGLGSAVAGIDDVTGDGVSDILAGAADDDAESGNAGAALIFDGATCAPVDKITDPGVGPSDDYGAAVAALEDLDGDGIGEIAVGDPLRDGPDGTSEGVVVVYRGSDRTELFRLFDPDGRSEDRFGRQIVGLGDVNDDGVPDIAVSSPFDDILVGETSAVDGGSVMVFSGVDGSWIRSFRDPDGRTGDNLGVALARIGDLDGDGVDDLIAGVPEDDEPASGAGTLVAFSPRTGASIRKFFDPNRGSNSGLGSSVAVVPDVDGDGIEDVLAGAPDADDLGAGSGHAVVFGGADGAVLHELSDPSGLPGDASGSAVTHLGDLSSGGTVEFVVGAETADPGGISAAGRVVVFSFEPDCDGDGRSSLLDCLDDDAGTFGGPGEATDLWFDDATTARWTPPPGGTHFGHDVVSSGDAADFDAAATCEATNTTATEATVEGVPSAGEVVHVLVRSRHRCGLGTLGSDSDGLERVGRACP